jgi:heme A synthase
MIGTLTSDTHSRAVRLWLYAVAALVLAMVLVGGATRLTESGLSITEWKPVTGVAPPLSQDAWRAEFEKYQATPQYRAMSGGMSLEAFKTIYWWEWTHRLLGRLVGAAFLLPFLFFLWRGWVAASLRPRRAAGRRRLVDGGVRPRRSRGSFAISFGDPPSSRLPDLCGAHLYGAALG